MNNSNNLYTDDFIKILIYETKELKMVNKQIKDIKIGFRNNLTAGDIEKSKEYLDLLKNVLYDNKRSLNIFYRQWHSYMQLLASNGYSEKVKDQSNIIKKEAIRENSIVGIACADLAHSSAYFFLKYNANAAEIIYNTLRSYQLYTT